MAQQTYDFQAETPPVELNRPQQALWWLKKGGLAVGHEWQRAHELCQMQEGDAAHDAVHALVHRIEGDEANASYWYRRAGRRPAETTAAEWQQIFDELER